MDRYGNVIVQILALTYFFVQISVFYQWMYISKMVTISPQIKLVSLYHFLFLACLFVCLFVILITLKFS